MPNYCENFLIVRLSNDSENQDNEKNLLNRFWDENRISDEDAHLYNYDSGQDLSFMRALPIKDDVSNVCDECVEKWGTKWDACDPSGSKDDSQIEYTFNTAWTPPLPWLKVVASKYPHLTFEMESKEPGVDYYVYILYENGIETERNETSYEAYLDEKYNTKEKSEEIIQLIEGNQQMLDNCLEIYLEESDYNSFEEYFDNVYDQEHDDDLKDIFVEIQRILDECEDSDVKSHICHYIDNHFESYHD